MTESETHADLQKRIAALIAPLRDSEDPDWSPGSWQVEEGMLPWFERNAVVDRFVMAACKHGWVLTDFDWTSWDQGYYFIENREAIETASIADLERLLTILIRKDRFCEGSLAESFSSGLLAAIVRRLQVIADGL